jgi:hypothetical protein
MFSYVVSLFLTGIVQCNLANAKIHWRSHVCQGLFSHREYFAEAALRKNPIFDHRIIVLTLIVHLMLGYRRLRDMDYYWDDLMVLRFLGLRKLPDLSTVSMALARVDDKSIIKLRQACREMLLARLQTLRLVRVSLGSHYVSLGSNLHY